MKISKISQIPSVTLFAPSFYPSCENLSFTGQFAKELNRFKGVFPEIAFEVGIFPYKNEVLQKVECHFCMSKGYLFFSVFSLWIPHRHSLRSI